MSVIPSVLAHAPAHHDQRSITILGATGSIGTSTIDLVRRGGDAYRVEAVTAANNAEALAALARSLNARYAAVARPELYGALKDALAGSGIEAAAGEDAVTAAAQRPADWVMAAITGAAGLKPALAAADRGATVALANKECLVCAGNVFMRHAKEGGAIVLPVDSEHNAIFQALGSGHWDDVKRIILTASGGPFRTWTREQMKSVTLEQALKHPNWSMGPKITIDSATMMNKGLEIIEAHYIFDLPASKIDAIVHAQSLVHGIVEFRDGSMLAQLGPPDMRVPIACCLAWPHRMDGAARLDFTQMSNLTFEPPDEVRFPSLGLARRALETGGGAPTVLNAANEIAAYSFIDGKIGFAGIPALVEATLDGAIRRGNLREPDTLEDALATDQAARALALELLPEIAVKTS